MIQGNLLEMLRFQQFAATYREMGTYPNMFWTPRFFDGMNPQRNADDEIRYINVSGQNSVGKGNFRGNRARIVEGYGYSSKRDGIFVQFDSMTFRPEVLRAMTNPDSVYLMDKGRQVYIDQSTEFNRQAVMFKEVLTQSLMLYHRINLDADGNILRPVVDGTTGAITDASGTAISADFGIPDTNRGSIDGIIDVKWDDPAADIQKQILEIRDYALKNGMPAPTNVVMHELDLPLLLNNNQFQLWAVTNTPRPTELLTGNGAAGTVGKGFEDLWGMRWEFVNGYYEHPSTGDQAAVIPKGLAMFYADPSQWLRAYNGVSCFAIDPASGFASAEMAMGQLQEVEGLYGYAQLFNNPARVEAFRGDAFGWSIPKAGVFCPQIRSALEFTGDD